MWRLLTRMLWQPQRSKQLPRMFPAPVSCGELWQTMQPDPASSLPLQQEACVATGCLSGPYRSAHPYVIQFKACGTSVLPCLKHQRHYTARALAHSAAVCSSCPCINHVSWKVGACGWCDCLSTGAATNNTQDCSCAEHRIQLSLRCSGAQQQCLRACFQHVEADAPPRSS